MLGIQARTNSKRLYNKVTMQVGDLSMIHMILHQCMRVAGWFSAHKEINIKPVLLIPKGDPIKDHVVHKVTVFEGPENDVLTRYKEAADFFNADYIIRITGDCPWISAQIISKCLRDAVRKGADYSSNILVRTFIEGLDTEVISKKLLAWLDEKAVEPHDREHVTTRIFKAIENAEDFPFGVHTVLNSFDLSDIKTSIDTQEEYDRACGMFDSYQQKKYKAASYGSFSV